VGDLKFLEPLSVYAWRREDHIASSNIDHRTPFGVESTQQQRSPKSTFARFLVRSISTCNNICTETHAAQFLTAYSIISSRWRGGRLSCRRDEEPTPEPRIVKFSIRTVFFRFWEAAVGCHVRSDWRAARRRVKPLLHLPPRFFSICSTKRTRCGEDNARFIWGESMTLFSRGCYRVGARRDIRNALAPHREI